MMSKKQYKEKDVAKMLRRISNKSGVENMSLILPTSPMELPAGTFYLKGFLRYIARALDGTIK